MHVSARSRPTWDPRFEPWVPVLTDDGTAHDLSLVQVFERAETLHSVTCGTAGEGVAVIEYLLAVCFAAGEFPASSDDWQAWVTGKHGFGRALDWLREGSADDWDLFHPERPLAQNSQLAPMMAESGTGPAQLIIERSGDYSQFFDHHHLEHGEPITAAEAFRAVLVQHVYGLAGRARLSGRHLGPTLTNLAAGRLQGRIRVVVLGRSVGDTLRLNLYPAPDGRVGHFNHSWEAHEFKRREFQEKPPGRSTTGPADLHSYLGRSVLLRPGPPGPGDRATVDRVLLGAGELLSLDSERDLEDAVYFQKLNGHRKPLWPSPTRALWREAHALYSAVQESGEGLFGRLRGLKFPDGGDDQACRLWAVGLLANKTLVTTWTEGSFPYAPSQGAALCEASGRGSDTVEYVARALERAAYVAWKIVYPNPKPSDAAAQRARFDARREFWPAAEAPFYRLLDDTAEGKSVTPLLREYAGELRSMAEGFLKDRLGSLPGNDKGYVARARAEQRFQDDMNRPNAPDDLRGEADTE